MAVAVQVNVPQDVLQISVSNLSNSKTGSVALRMCVYQVHDAAAPPQQLAAPNLLAEKFLHGLSELGRADLAVAVGVELCG